MTLTARCGVAGPPVQDAEVVDDEEVAGGELELDAVLGCLEHAAEALIRVVVEADDVLGQPE